MKKRAMSMLLVLLMVVTLLPTFALPASAADENGTIKNPAPATDESGNLHLTKALAPGANGTYDITMESWATGEVKTQGITEKIPTDFVLVVDQSGSMDTTDMPTGTPSVQNGKYLEDVATGRYYYKDGDNYYRVYGVKDYLFHYYPANYWYVGDMIDRYGLDTSWFMGNEEASATLDNRMYFREEVNGETYYQPITMQIRGMFLAYGIRFSFNSKQTNDVYWFDREVTTYSSNNKSPWYKTVTGTVRSEGRRWSNLNGIVQTAYTNDNDYTFSEVLGINTGMMINYPMYERKVGYTKLCYRDVNGVEHEVPSTSNNQSVWEFCNGSGQALNGQEGSRPTYNGLYTFPTTTDRITALKAALTEFADAVANETDDFGAVDNRVSIVGFSSSGYNNTELLTHTERDISSGSTNGWQKGNCDGNASEYYGKGLVGATNGNVGTVNPKITNAITAITANGGTQPEDGLNMAYQVLTNRSNTTYTIRSGDHIGQSVDRNTIVIFFTDGQPGDYHYSDQYTEANDVVQEALKIKQLKNSDNEPLDTTIFTIGVFGESDANPLTYTHDTRTNSQGEDQDWKYLGGWMESYHDPYSPYSWYCLRRQWRPNSASASDNYTAEPNDTIFDYMSVVSSNYPNAEQFIAPSWLSGNYTGADGYTGATDGVRHKETAETTNKYYRMASNQDTLIAAFLQAVTMNNEEITSDTSVPLNETAIFKDKVNLADFDTTGATYTVKWQPVVMTANGLQNDTSRQTTTVVNGAAYPADGINYEGFNYSGNFVTTANPGQKLVITINGLTPKKTVGELKSNDGNAGVYGPEDEDPTVSITSPTLQFPESAAKTYVIDFNAKMTVATDTTKLVGATNDTVTGTNGSFVKSGTNVTYQLSSGNQAEKAAEINKAYTGVDTATVYGKLVKVENAKLGWNQITTVPASSVYYDDDFTGDNAPVVNVGDGHGKTDIPSTGTIDASGAYYFTFYGTGIDVYCTTHGDAGYVTATVFVGTKADVKVDNRLDLRLDPNNNAYKPRTIKNYSATAYSNTPTVSYTNLPADTYTIKLSASEGAQYKLDGVRVYDPVKAGTDAATELNKTAEANALYLNLHSLLLNAKDGYAVTRPEGMSGAVDPEALASGVLFVDDASNIVTESNWYKDEGATEDTWHDTPAKIYQTQFDVYKTNSPKNEIYLSANQALTFQLDTDKAPAGGTVWLGLSAPAGGTVKVSITGNTPVTLTSKMDMYYPITVPTGGSITITADKDNTDIVSVTNLKITDASQQVPAADGQNADAILEAQRAFFKPVTMKTIRMAANDGVDPEEVVTETDTPNQPGEPDTPDKPDQPDDPTPGGAGSVQEMLKQLFESLMKNLFGLFKGLGNW